MLQRNSEQSLMWSSEQGMRTLLEAIVDFATSPEERLHVLRQTGGFRFEQGITAEEMQVQVSDVFGDLSPRVDRAAFDAATARLGAVWSPQQGSPIEFIIANPNQIARLLVERLTPSTARYLGIIGHTFQRVRRTDLEPLAVSQTVAYVRGSEIHLIVGVSEVLGDWELKRDTGNEGEGFSLLETLLLHEVVEILLREKMPRIDPLSSHVIASTLERTLSEEDLPSAVEDFFDSWIPPTATRERRAIAEVVESDNRRGDRRQEESAAWVADREEQPSEMEVNVLVVDSSTMMRHKICQIVKELGYGTLEAADGKEGFDLAKRHNPGLILLDLLAPEMDGVEMLKQLRADNELANLNVIVLTTVASKEIIRETQELGVRDFLLKPLVADEAKKRMQKYLGEGASAQ